MIKFTKQETMELFELAQFALLKHYDEAAQYMDLSDEYLEPLKLKLDAALNPTND